MSNSASIRRWTFIRDGSARKEHTKSEQASCCAAIVEPSPTGRDASGLLSRKVTGEVSEAAAATQDETKHGAPRNLRVKWRPRHFAISISSHRVQGSPLPKEV